MSDGNGFAARCAVLASGLLGSVALPFFVGPAALGLLADPLREVLKDLFKGVTGDHFPSLSQAVMERIKGVDPSKLNHHVAKGLEHAVRQTEKTIRFRVERRDKVKLTKADKDFLVALREGILTAMQDQFRNDPGRRSVDRWIRTEPTSTYTAFEKVYDAIRSETGRTPNDLDHAILDHYEADLRLHFAEFIKDPKHHAARVAFEDITADALLTEVRSIGEKLGAVDQMNVKLDAISAAILASGQAEQYRQNLGALEARYPDAEHLQVVVSGSMQMSFDAMDAQLKALQGMLSDVDQRTMRIEGGVERVHTSSRTNVRLTVVVLCAILGVGAFLALDPLHFRTFPFKVQVDKPLDYGADDRVVGRVAISYGNGLTDTATVKEGIAGFQIPNGNRNDDAVVQLLCTDPGQTARQAWICESRQVLLSDKERLLFTAVAPPATEQALSTKPAPAVKKQGSTDETIAKQGGKPPCSIEGLEYVNDGSLEDRLVLAGHSGGTVSISGEVNRKPVDGRLRVNGPVLTAVTNEGTLTGGHLELVQDCAQLKGTLSVRSPSGITVNLRVNMVNSSR